MGNRTFRCSTAHGWSITSDKLKEKIETVISSLYCFSERISFHFAAIGRNPGTVPTAQSNVCKR